MAGKNRKGWREIQLGRVEIFGVTPRGCEAIMVKITMYNIDICGQKRWQVDFIS